MPALVAGIHVLLLATKKVVDGRNKSGHDGVSRPLPIVIDRKYLPADRLGRVGGEKHRKRVPLLYSLIRIRDRLRA